jgi:hypothetical protein
MSTQERKAASYRSENPDFARWAKGYGVIRHSDLTQARIHEMERLLVNKRGDGVAFYQLLHALDRVTSAGMWLVVHETYVRNVYLDGSSIRQISNHGQRATPVARSIWFQLMPDISPSTF